MRNNLVHGYRNINYDVLWEVITDKLPPLVAELNRLIEANTELRMADPVESNANDKPEISEEEPIVTTHELVLGGDTLSYSATVGKMPLKDEKDKIVAQIFYTAYTLETDADLAGRPLIFVFNGGPGSASIWLHMGALGPKRVDMGEEGFMPPPPFTSSSTTPTPGLTWAIWSSSTRSAPVIRARPTPPTMRNTGGWRPIWKPWASSSAFISRATSAGPRRCIWPARVMAPLAPPVWPVT